MVRDVGHGMDTGRKEMGGRVARSVTVRALAGMQAARRLGCVDGVKYPLP